MNDHIERAKQIQEMLRKLTGAVRQQLIEMLVRKYGSEADMAELLDAGPLDGAITVVFDRSKPLSNSGEA